MAAEISAAGLMLVKRFEGYVKSTLPDPVGIPTVGYGHVVRQFESTKYPPGTIITEAQASALLIQDMKIVKMCLDRWVRVPLTQEQSDALHSFIFNIGCTAFQKSTLLHKLNAGDYVGAARELPRWNKAGNPPKPLVGLTSRRLREQEIFVRGVVGWNKVLKVAFLEAPADEPRYRYATCA